MPSGCRLPAVDAGADDVQVQRVHRGDIGLPFPGELIEAGGKRKVEDRLALRAVEMGVGRALSFESRGGLAVRADLPGQTLLPEEIEVSVHRPQADVGENLARFLVDRLRGRVGPAFPENLQDYRALLRVSGLFSRRFHDMVIVFFDWVNVKKIE